ncbi:phage head-tail adapter protein [Rhodovulum sulfidophilum]|uniref:Head-tail adaptor protein n=1 Tax=Rhodovulum visakhapatnamense TaxID=364297 RepID=A0ABS1RN68_9RHOB|nr:head-tail adaptor protein [Rhodovulum visakhapatnamense]MBL3571523.1 head-tail adaptor protein [Rhodovulum visakhapatnamense]MBL3580332.1 head-tail adaptor protein [Rhodovulum visakhapatnamense]OLS46022.1 phage head-tail adapter protein [Rhodovulum sulfidophilum]
MAAPRAGELPRVVRFERARLVDDGLAMVERWAPHGRPQRAKRTDLSDAERWRAAEIGASVTTRFVLRRTAFTADLTPKDRLSCDGLSFAISGIRELAADPRFLELTCTARTDR